VDRTGVRGDAPWQRFFVGIPVLAKLLLSCLLIDNKFPNDNSPTCHRMLQNRRPDPSETPAPVGWRV